MPLFAYVANLGSGSLSVINTQSNTVVNTIASPQLPYQIAITPNGYFAYIMSGSEVLVLSLATNTFIATIPLAPYNNGGGAIICSPDGGHIYAATTSNLGGSGCNTLTIISTTSNTVVATVNAFTPTVGAGNDAGSLAIKPDGSKVYMNCDSQQTIAVFDTSTNTLSGTITSVPTTGSGLNGLAITPDGSTLYVANGSPVGTIQVFATLTNTLITTITPNSQEWMGGLIVSSDGTKVYASAITDPGGGGSQYDLLTIATSSNTITHTTNLGASSGNIDYYNLTLTPDGSTLYLVNTQTGTVTVYSTGTNTVVATITVGSSPDGIELTNFSGYSIVMNT